MPNKKQPGIVKKAATKQSRINSGKITIQMTANNIATVRL